MALDSKKITRIIFDLDDTLFDTNGLLVAPAFREACQAMIKMGLKATLQNCVDFRKTWMNQGQRGDVYKEMVKNFGTLTSETPSAVSKAGFDAFHHRDIKEEILLFPETTAVLQQLRENYDLYLVTLGGVSTQKKKVKLLHIEGFFNEIFYVDIEKDKTKVSAFEKISSYSPASSPHSHLSVGNRVDSEIRDAKKLGFQTILVVRGEYLNLKPTSLLEEPDAKIKNLHELLGLLP